MVDFRRCITAIAGFALFTGLASAQIVVGTNTGAGAGGLTCTATVSVPPQLRAEGMTELIGDIVLSCTGGASLVPGASVPTANITVSLGTNVTSRLLGSGSVTNASEALLMIDEPGSSVAGAAATQNLCGTPAVGAGPGGCVQTVSATGAALCAATGATGCTAGTPTNLFQGLVTANQVTFQGVPINPPVTGGFARVFRITNVRANVAGLGGGGLAGTTQLLASIAISGSTSLPVSNPVLIAGFVQAGLSTSRRNVNNTDSLSVPSLAQCGGSSSPSSLAVLQFSENFGTAFKTRVAPTSATAGSGQGTGFTAQNIPGTIYNSESGFVTGVPAISGNGFTAGLADYGTRLKAVFNNVPAGVRLFVSTTNVTNTSTVTSGVAAPAGNSTSSYAVLVLSETAPDANGIVPVASSTTSVNTGNTLLAEIPVVNGSATAVWEVINTNSSGLDTLNFGVWQQFSANPGANSPPPGTATVNLSYAPTPTAAFTAAAGATASGSLTIPRFQDTSAAQNILTVALCQTSLLFPFVTNQGGFDTGLAIANTTTDPFGTRNQSGGCTLNFYGASAPAAVATGNVATGTVYTTLVSTSAAGFQGYIIAQCNFQLAHGFAFISDLGAQKLQWDPSR